MQPPYEETLDPPDWEAFRAKGHQMLDDILNYMQHLRKRPVWQPIPHKKRVLFKEKLPKQPTDILTLHKSFMQNILPFSIGNAHPGFMGWVQGGGTAVGMLADMLAAGLNANLGGRDQIPVEVERQVLSWVQELFDFPESSTGLFVTGTSIANMIAVLVARTHALGANVRRTGLTHIKKTLIAYTSIAAHRSVAQAMDLTGIGTDALRLIPTDEQGSIDVSALKQAITKDRRSKLTPFFIVGTAGTTDTGAIDDLKTLANIAHEEKLWYHLDGAYGALAKLAPDISPRLIGIERADSIAFDFHKWGQVPYDAGFILVRDGSLHYDTFALPAAYLRREKRGMAANSPWFCDFGPDLSRSFRALKTWFTIKAYGTHKLGKIISNTCALAQYLKKRIEAEPSLELLAPVSLNIVCFRYRCSNPDLVNAEIAISLQESGIAATSTTLIKGQLALRAAIFNHRTHKQDIDAMLEAILQFGDVFAKRGH